MMDALTRTFQAELRAVEEGHQARRRDADDPTVYVVKSDTHPDLTYTVHADYGYVAGLTAAPTFSCDHLFVQGISNAQARSVAPGLAPCKHAALVARRLEREGLIVWNEHYGWVAAPDVVLSTALRPPRRSTVTDADLFDL